MCPCAYYISMQFIAVAFWPLRCDSLGGDEFAMLLLFQDIEAWVPPTPPGKVLLDSLVACAKVVFEGNGGESGGRGIAATRAADVMSRG